MRFGMSSLLVAYALGAGEPTIISMPVLGAPRRFEQTPRGTGPKRTKSGAQLRRNARNRARRKHR